MADTKGKMNPLLQVLARTCPMAWAWPAWAKVRNQKAPMSSIGLGRCAPPATWRAQNCRLSWPDLRFGSAGFIDHDLLRVRRGEPLTEEVTPRLDRRAPSPTRTPWGSLMNRGSKLQSIGAVFRRELTDHHLARITA